MTWIDIEDGKPSDGEEVLVCNCGMVELTIYYGEQYGADEWDCMDPDGITHWMPIPRTPSDG